MLKKRNKLLIKPLLFFTICGFYSITNAQTNPQSGAFGVGIRPSNAEFVAEPGKSFRHTIEVQNVSNMKAVKLVVSAIDWTLDDKNKLILLEPNKAENSAVSWLSLRPNTMLLQPGQSQKVLVDINTPINIEKNEYRAAVLISTVLPSQEERAKQNGVWNRWQVASLMYFSPKENKDIKSPIVKNYKIERSKDFSFNGENLEGSLNITNNENYHLRLLVKNTLKDSSGKEIDTHTDNIVVLPGKELKDLNYKLKFKNIDVGNYKVEQSISNIFSPYYKPNQIELLTELKQDLTPASFFGKK